MSTRAPAVAGQFYPGNPRELEKIVTEYITDSEIEPAPDRVAAIVAPHAGYVYSGSTAGYVYARVRGKKPKRVILLGCSHRYIIDTASVYEAGAFSTPVASFPIDEAFAAKLAKTVDASSAVPHVHEHAIEVQLPFVWAALGVVPIVPVLFGGPAGNVHVEAGRTLARMADESDLVIASTDLSHYLSDDRANAKDRHSIDTVLTQDCTALIQGLAQETCAMCGGAAVVAAMAFALERGAEVWSLLDYRTSASASGDHSRVVGYAAIVMERPS